jgi:two-component system cell cycle response regulator
MSFSPTHLLVIEDNATNRALMTYLLKAFGYKVSEAEDGEQGVQFARSEAPHLIVCDIHLPKMDGYEVVQRLKSDEATKNIPVVAVTALAMVGDRDRILAAGFDGYVSKPIEPETFVDSVSAFLSPELRSTAKQRSTAAAGAPVSQKAAQGKSRTVLVIDDQLANIDFAKSTLEPFGYEVLTANGIRDGLAAAGNKRPDLVLCDLHMSPLGGLDLLKVAKTEESLRDVPIVIISSTYTLDNERRDCLQSGAANFISRPIEPQALLAELDKTLTKSAAP